MAGDPTKPPALARGPLTRHASIDTDPQDRQTIAPQTIGSWLSPPSLPQPPGRRHNRTATARGSAASHPRALNTWISDLALHSALQDSISSGRASPPRSRVRWLAP